MTALSFSLLDRDMRSSSFNCGNPSINRLIRCSYFPTILQHGYCFEVKVDHTIVGYFMITLQSINLSEAPDRVSSMVSEICEQCAVAHIKYLAVDERLQNMGIGTSILRGIVGNIRRNSAVLPIRLIQLDALKSRYSWYAARGFTAYDENDLQNTEETILMYLDCLSAQSSIALQAYMAEYDETF